MKLSQRLEAAADVACNPLDVALYREAAALAKSVERASIATFAPMPGTLGGYGMIVRDREYVGRTVALVPLPQQSET